MKRTIGRERELDGKQAGLSGELSVKIMFCKLSFKSE